MRLDCFNEGRVALLNKLRIHAVLSVYAGKYVLQIERNCVKDRWIHFFEFFLKPYKDLDDSFQVS